MAQSTDSPEPQSCRAHSRQNHKLIILAEIPQTIAQCCQQRDPFLHSTCDQLIPIEAA